jgi:hypothetical protein
MKSALNIGAEVTGKATANLKELVLAILATPAGDKVKKAALATIVSAFKVEGVSVNSCNFQMGKEKKK